MSILSIGAPKSNPGGGQNGRGKGARRLRPPWLRPFVSILFIVTVAIATSMLLYARSRVLDRVQLGFEQLQGVTMDVSEQLSTHKSVLSNLAHFGSAPARSEYATTRFHRIVLVGPSCSEDHRDGLVAGSAPLEIEIVACPLVGYLKLERLVRQPEAFDGVVLVDRSERILHSDARLPPLQSIEGSESPKTRFDPFGWYVLPRISAGGKRYVLQCVPASLPDLEDGAGLRACGLVEEGALRRHALALSPLASTWIFALIASLFLALPYVKVRFMGRRERLRAIDMQLLACSGVLVAGLGTVSLLQVHAIGAIQGRADEDLTTFLERAQEHFDREIREAHEQLLTSAQALAESARRVDGAILAKEEKPFAYPFFDAVALTRGPIQERKWMTRVDLTRMIRVDEYAWYKAALQLTPSARREFVFDQIIAPTSSLTLAILAVPARLPPRRNRENFGTEVGIADRTGLALIATPLISVQHAVTKYPNELLVVEKEGQIAFRSDQIVRRLVRLDDEWDGANTLLDGNGSLRASQPSNHRHQGRMQRMSALRSVTVPTTTLVAFYDKNEMEKMASQAIRAPLLMALLLAALLVGTALVAQALHADALAWMWPTVRRDRWYSVSTLGLFSIGVALHWVPGLPRRWLGTYVLLGVPLAVVACLCIFSAWRRAREAVGLLSPVIGRLPSWYPGSYVAFGLMGLVSLVAVPVWVTGLDAVRAHDDAYVVAGSRQDEQRVSDWWERLDRTVVPVASPSRLDELPGKSVPIRPSNLEPYEAKASELACHLSAERCQRQEIPQREPPSLTCSSLFVADTERLPSVHFSASLAACWAALSGKKLAHETELFEVANGEGLGDRPSVSPAYLLVEVAGLVGLLIGMGWLIHSAGRSILGLELEGDGVIDRSDAVQSEVGSWLLLRPSEVDLENVLKHLGIANANGNILDLSLPGASTARLRADGPIVVRHAERSLGDPGWSNALRTLLVRRRSGPVVIASEIDPLHYWVSRLRDDLEVREPSFQQEAVAWAAALVDVNRVRFRLPAPIAEPKSDMERLIWEECGWAAHLRAMRSEVERVAKRDGLDRNQISDLVRDFADPYYCTIWNLCSVEERLVLRQLADEGVVNPRCFDVLRRLSRRRLVRVDPRFRLASESLRRFVQEAETETTIQGWERPDGDRGSLRIRGPLLAMAVVAGLLLAFVQEEEALAVMSLAAAALPLLKGVVGMVQKDAAGLG